MCQVVQRHLKKKTYIFVMLVTVTQQTSLSLYAVSQWSERAVKISLSMVRLSEGSPRDKKWRNSQFFIKNIALKLCLPLWLFGRNSKMKSATLLVSKSTSYPRFFNRCYLPQTNGKRINIVMTNIASWFATVILFREYIVI